MADDWRQFEVTLSSLITVAVVTSYFSLLRGWYVQFLLFYLLCFILVFVLSFIFLFRSVSWCRLFRSCANGLVSIGRLSICRPSTSQIHLERLMSDGHREMDGIEDCWLIVWPCFPIHLQFSSWPFLLVWCHSPPIDITIAKFQFLLRHLLFVISRVFFWPNWDVGFFFVSVSEFGITECIFDSVQRNDCRCSTRKGFIWNILTVETFLFLRHFVSELTLLTLTGGRSWDL